MNFSAGGVPPCRASHSIPMQRLLSDRFPVPPMRICGSLKVILINDIGETLGFMNLNKIIMSPHNVYQRPHSLNAFMRLHLEPKYRPTSNISDFRRGQILTEPLQNVAQLIDLLQIEVPRIHQNTCGTKNSLSLMRIAIYLGDRETDISHHISYPESAKHGTAERPQQRNSFRWQ